MMHVRCAIGGASESKSTNRSRSATEVTAMPVNSNYNADPPTQAEKRETIENDRKVREAAKDEARAGTYFAQARATLGQEVGGRYAAMARPVITGAGAYVVPRLPESSPWSHDPCAPEPPLGYSVEDQEPVGEAHEIQNLKQGA
jgi:hypothetical protein